MGFDLRQALGMPSAQVGKYPLRWGSWLLIACLCLWACSTGAI